MRVLIKFEDVDLYGIRWKVILNISFGSFVYLKNYLNFTHYACVFHFNTSIQYLKS